MKLRRARSLRAAVTTHDEATSSPGPPLTVFGKRNVTSTSRAAAVPVEPRVLKAIDELFLLDDEATLRYDDGRRGVGRRVRVSDGGMIEAVRLAGDLGAEAWLRDLFEEAAPVMNAGALLLAPTARLPAASARSKTVCSCWGVAESAICDFVASSTHANVLNALQSTLKCGTQCGSCLPELKRLVASGKAAA